MPISPAGSQGPPGSPGTTAPLVAAGRFPPSSRYATTPIVGYVDADGTVHPIVGRRLVPPPERFATLTEHTVTQADRLDRIAATYLGDPEQYWRVCDANRAMRPDTLTERLGRRLRITLPEGIPGPPDA